MKQLNKRQIDLLNLLISDNSYKPIKDFARQLHVSDKTISSDLNVVQSVINEIGAEIKRRTGKGIKLLFKDNQFLDLIDIVNNQDSMNSEMSVEQRRVEIARNLLIHSKEYITIQGLSDKYFVSRTSIINDLKNVEEEFKEFNIQILSSRRGTRISAKEIDIRNALVYFIQANINYNSFYLIEYQILRKNEHHIDGLANVNEISFFENLLNDLEKNIKGIINEPYYTNLLTHLLIMTRRIEDGNRLDDFEKSEFDKTLFNQEIYKNMLIITEKIEKQYDMEICDKERLYIYQYLISSGLNKGSKEILNAKSELGVLSEKFTKQLILTVSDLVGIDFTFNNKLYQQLSLHIKPMLNRLNSGIIIKNPLVDEMREEFTQIFLITKISCQLVCNKLNLDNISLDEIAYIVTYFQSEVEEVISLEKKLDVLVICHSGYGTAQLLATRLKRRFSEINVIDIISSSNIESVDLNNIDLIISTVKFEIGKPYIFVSALLRESDIRSIQNLIDNQTVVVEKFSIQNQIKVDDIFMFSDSKDLMHHVKKSKSIEINKDKLIELGKDIYLYMVESKNNRTILFSNTGNKKGKVYVFKYQDDNYLLKKLKDFLRGNKKIIPGV